MITPSSDRPDEVACQSHKLTHLEVPALPPSYVEVEVHQRYSSEHIHQIERKAVKKQYFFFWLVLTGLILPPFFCLMVLYVTLQSVGCVQAISDVSIGDSVRSRTEISRFCENLSESPK